MAGRKSKADKMAEAQAGLLSFLQSAGMDVQEEDVAKALNDEDRYTPKEHPDVPMLQAEGVLLYLENRARNFMPKICKWCGQAFSTMYKNVAYCSTLCSGTALQKRMGIKWDYNRDTYAMIDAERPLIVGPQAYALLVAMAEKILEGHYLLLEEHAQQPSDQKDHESFEDTLTNPEALDTTPEPSLPQSTDPSLEGGPFGFGPSPF